MAPLVEDPAGPPIGDAAPPPGSAAADPCAATAPPTKGPGFNAVDHGLTARTHFPAGMQAEIDGRIAELTIVHQPRTEHERALVRIMARGAVQWDHASALQVHNRDRIMERAETSWDRDRREYVLELGARLARDPERCQDALLRTVQGVTYIIKSWDDLLGILNVNDAWDEAQRSRALDLLGVRPEMRNGCPLVRPGGESQRGVAEREIAWLRQQLKAVQPGDATDRGMALERDADGG
jgi:hypothetical protein